MAEDVINRYPVQEQVHVDSGLGDGWASAEPQGIQTMKDLEQHQDNSRKVESWTS